MTNLLIIIIYVGFGIYIGVETYNKIASDDDYKNKFAMVLITMCASIWPLIVIGFCIWENQKNKSNGKA